MNEKKTIKIQVTAAHIAKGKRGDARSCPIAQALLGLGCGRPRVDGVGVAFVDGSRSYGGGLPDHAYNAMARYDFIGKMEPFEFELEVEAK